MIPVTVLTGFLGSGKTTLLARLLKTPAFARTAVIINEFGEIGIDHDLVEAGEESFVQLETGCLCCASRGDIEATIVELLTRREAGTVPPFERIVIETSGLADPAPILSAVVREAARGTEVCLGSVVTTVDCAAGLHALAHEANSARQVAVADLLVLTKADLAEASPRLLASIAAINPRAPRMYATFGDADADRLLGIPRDPAADLEGWPWRETHNKHAHDHELQCVAVRRERPVPALLLTMLLETLADQCGEGLLRLKGIVNIAERPGRPAVIHGVQHLFHAPTWLDRWPSHDRSTRLVLIGRGFSAAWIELLISALEAELTEMALSVEAGMVRSERLMTGL